MFHSYRSEYANQLHQLLVTPSRHITITKDGRLSFQKKALDVNLARLAKSTKQHVVHYIIRDHYSGVFYAELISGSKLIPVQEFLLRAWSEKEKYPFCGAPEYISIPKSVERVFPVIRRLIERAGIQITEVTSGFQGGVGDVRTWESYIRQYCSIREELGFVKAWTPDVTCGLSAYLNCRHPYREAKINKWSSTVKELRVPS